MQVKTFNTGRLYQRDGQWIGYAELARLAPDFERTLIAFADVSRMIDGVVTIRGDVTDAAVLAAYDAGGYGAVADSDLVREIERRANAARTSALAEHAAASLDARP